MFNNINVFAIKNLDFMIGLLFLFLIFLRSLFIDYSIGELL